MRAARSAIGASQRSSGSSTSGYLRVPQGKVSLSLIKSSARFMIKWFWSLDTLATVRFPLLYNQDGAEHLHAYDVYTYSVHRNVKQ